MSAQQAMQGLAGSILRGASAASGAIFSATKGKEFMEGFKASKNSKSGKDMKMAEKSRKVYQDKIKAIYSNKELSEKARTRRMGKVLDEYKGGE